MLKKTTNKLFKNVSNKRICVIGDLMLDLYLLGNVKRISPEAPVQVFEKRDVMPKLGGAANVGLNIVSLGAKTMMFGVIGNDEEGKILMSEFRKHGIDNTGVITMNDRPTTSKTRVIAASHHLIRIDSESKQDIPLNTEKRILEKLRKNIKKINIIILQDYNKGVLTKNLIAGVIKIAKEFNVRVLVDPKFDNFFEYKDAFVFKPNRKELQDAMAKRVIGTADIENAANELISDINCQNLVLTLGEEGMILFEKMKNSVTVTAIKTHARKVADVSGAGDTVISTMAVALSGGASIKDAVKIANVAAGLVVEEVGIVPIYKDNLINHINSIKPV